MTPPSGFSTSVGTSTSLVVTRSVVAPAGVACAGQRLRRLGRRQLLRARRPRQITSNVELTKVEWRNEEESHTAYSLQRTAISLQLPAVSC